MKSKRYLFEGIIVWGAAAALLANILLPAQVAPWGWTIQTGPAAVVVGAGVYVTLRLLGGGMSLVDAAERDALEVLSEADEPLPGTEILERSRRLGRGQVYVVLLRLAQRGLVRSREHPENGGPVKAPRRVFWLTRKGQAEARRELEEGEG